METLELEEVEVARYESSSEESDNEHLESQTSQEELSIWEQKNMRQTKEIEEHNSEKQSYFELLKVN